ncbi:hypothetical protein [Haloechinothrix salitolerans]|uniref:Uncharacterized protein n=1 Tax=Haloechinothrix salitolerans TaxID=926830 RepID=A0ABW2BVP6_9PSEU
MNAFSHRARNTTTSRGRDDEHPAWCANHHSDDDRGSDRDCVSAWERQIRLAHGQWRALVVHLHQPYGTDAPRVVLTPNSTNHPACHEFSRDEAKAVSRVLLEAVFRLERTDHHAR